MSTKKYLKLGSTSNDNDIQMKICRKGKNNIKSFQKNKDQKNMKLRNVSLQHSVNKDSEVKSIQTQVTDQCNVNQNTNFGCDGNINYLKELKKIDI